MAHPYWPLFDLRVRTPRLVLAVPTDEDLVEIAALAARGIHEPERMPFAVPWSDRPSPELERRMMQFHWGRRSELGPESWNLDLVVREGDRIVGMQGIMAKDFPVLRSVHSGSWLGREHQRRGIGTEMRQAILHLAFAGLGAEVATSSAFLDNPASERISRKLGYAEDGYTRFAPRGKALDGRRFRLTRPAWDASPAAHEVEVRLEGLEACLPLLGAAAAP